MPKKRSSKKSSAGMATNEFVLGGQFDSTEAGYDVGHPEKAARKSK